MKEVTKAVGVAKKCRDVLAVEELNFEGNRREIFHRLDSNGAPARQLWYAFPQVDRTDLTENVPEAMMPPDVIRPIFVSLCGAFASLEQAFAFVPSLQPTACLLRPAYSVEALRKATFDAVQYPVLLIDLVGLAFSQWLLLGQLLGS